MVRLLRATNKLNGGENKLKEIQLKETEQAHIHRDI